MQPQGPQLTEAMDLQFAQAIWQHAEAYAASLPSPFGGAVQEREDKDMEEKAEEEKEMEEEAGTKRHGEESEEAVGLAEKKRRREEAAQEVKRTKEGDLFQDHHIGQKEIAELVEKAQREAEEEIKKKESSWSMPKGIWQGLKKAPLKVHYKGRVRDMCDGLGKCSPGVRPAGFRGKVRGEAAQRLREAFWSEVEDLVGSMTKKERLQLMARLALGKFERSPFEKDIEVRRGRMDQVLKGLGCFPERKAKDRSTAINFRRVQAFAKLMEDEDTSFLEGLASTGVPLGVRGEIPFRRKRGRRRSQASCGAARSMRSLGATMGRLLPTWTK